MVERTISAVKHPFFYTVGPSVEQCRVTVRTWLGLGSHPSLKIRNHELCMYTNMAILLRDEENKRQTRQQTWDHMTTRYYAFDIMHF